MAGHEKSMRQQEQAAARRRERTRERQARQENRGAPTLDKADAPISSDVFEDDAQDLAQAPLVDLLQISAVYLTMLHAGIGLWLWADTVTWATAGVPAGVAISITTVWSLLILQHAVRKHSVAPQQGVPPLETDTRLRVKAAAGGGASLLMSLLWMWVVFGG